METRSAAAGAVAVASGVPSTASNSCVNVNVHKQQPPWHHSKMPADVHLLAKDQQCAQLTIRCIDPIGTRNVGAAKEVQRAAQEGQGCTQMKHMQ
jgi:hypothetical protein